MAEIVAQVAKILGKYAIAINAGSDQGVPRGATVKLWRVEEISDPNSGASLGNVRIEKLRMKTTQIHELFCIAEVEAPSIIFSSLNFNTKPERSIATSAFNDADSVRVKVGEEVSISIASPREESVVLPEEIDE
jgi:hypothetical protein